MDPISLIVSALSAGALNGVRDAASQAVADAYASLRRQVEDALGGTQGAREVLERHAVAPEDLDILLYRELSAAHAETKPALIEASEELLREADPGGSRSGKYIVDLRGARGVQVGDGNTQTNTFSGPGNT